MIWPATITMPIINNIIHKDNDSSFSFNRSHRYLTRLDGGSHSLTDKGFFT